MNKLALVVSILLLAGCGAVQTQPTVQTSGYSQAAAAKRKPSLPPQEMLQLAKIYFNTVDLDGDKKLTKAEFQMLYKENVSAVERRKRADEFWLKNDKNKNGTLELSEFIQDFDRVFAVTDPESPLS